MTTCALLASLVLGVVSTAMAADGVTLRDLQKSLDHGEYDSVATRSQAYLQAHPGNRDARFLRALALAGQGKNAAALDAFKSLAADYPQRPEPANNLAVLYARDNQYKKAQHWLEKAMATQPAYATANRNLGDIYTALADLAYRRALGADDLAKKVPLTMLNRLYYTREAVASSGPSEPQPAPAAACQAGAVAPADETRSVLQTVRAWAQAWAQQDTDTYIDFYAADFDPGDSLTRSQWQAMRRSRLGQPEDLTIEINNPSVRRAGSDRVQVDFLQKYRTPGYSDSIKKQLLMQRTDQGWRILRETSVTDS